MKRYLTLLIAALMLLAMLASCGEQPENPPASSELPGSESAEPASESEPVSEPDTEPEPATEPEEPLPSPDKPVYEYEYAAPEDGSFTICGIPLSEYSLVLYAPTSAEYNFINRKHITARLKDPVNLATGIEWDLKVVKNEKYNTEKWAEHEILFGNNFQRDGIPEADTRKNYYGVTADGTVYFCSPSPMLYCHMWQLFLEEFFGVPYGSGEQSGGCALTECYRELPGLDEAWLKQQGYEIVFTDEFDGDALNLDVWDYRASGSRRNGFNAASQVSVKDGNLVLTGEYRTDGEYGEGWYGGMIALKKWYSRGYFKAVIRCSECIGTGSDFWSAFWVQGSDPYNPESCQGGIGPGGCEIDVLECWGGDVATSTVYVSGYEGNTDLDSDSTCFVHTGNNYAEEYHSFELIWDEDSYRFFVDGQLSFITTIGYGTSSAVEQVILSLEIPSSFSIQPGTVREMKVESLEIWQKPDAQE